MCMLEDTQNAHTPCSNKGRHRTHGGNCVNSQPIFKNFHLSVSSKSAPKYLLKIPLHLICVATLPCETLVSENERQSQTNAVIDDRLQGTVVTYLRYGGVVSLPVNNF